MFTHVSTTPHGLIDHISSIWFRFLTVCIISRLSSVQVLSRRQFKLLHFEHGLVEHVHRSRYIPIHELIIYHFVLLSKIPPLRSRCSPRSSGFWLSSSRAPWFLVFKLSLPSSVSGHKKGCVRNIFEAYGLHPPRKSIF